MLYTYEKFMHKKVINTMIIFLWSNSKNLINNSTKIGAKILLHKVINPELFRKI